VRQITVTVTLAARHGKRRSPYPRSR
jgi:hypothetical protein